MKVESFFRNKILRAEFAFTFRDAILLPRLAKSEPSEIDIRTKITKSRKMNLPFVSSPMDTVTGSRLAIALGRLGGIGVLHRNCGIDEEVDEARKVKEAEVDGYPNATLDEEGNLLCAAAISPFDLERAKKLDKYADILVIDVAHFHNVNCISAAKKLAKEVKAEIIVGNIGTYEAAEDVLTSIDEVAGFRVGIGSGSACLTMDLLKSGCPTLYSVAQVADAILSYGEEIPIIADGGIRCAGDIALALAAGADSAMMGYIFAGCEESLGDVEVIEGKKYKRYRGMGSPSAMEKRYAFDRYGSSKGIPEGIEGLVPYRGSVKEVVEELLRGLKASMGYAGARSIKELHEEARIALLTAAGIEEARPHGILQI